MNALANPEVGKFLNENFVSSFQKVGTFRIVKLVGLRQRQQLVLNGDRLLEAGLCLLVVARGALQIGTLDERSLAGESKESRSHIASCVRGWPSQSRLHRYLDSPRTHRELGQNPRLSCIDTVA